MAFVLRWCCWRRFQPAARGAGHFCQRAEVVVIDVESTDILFQKNSTQPMTPSSMTKVMTAYLVFNALQRGEISLSTEFEVSQEAASRGGSTMLLPKGEVTVDDLLRG